MRLSSVIDERKERERERELHNTIDELFKSELRLEATLATIDAIRAKCDALKQKTLFPRALVDFAKVSSKFSQDVKSEMDSGRWNVGGLLLQHARNCAVLLQYCAEFSSFSKLWINARKEPAFASLVQTTLESASTKERDAISLLIAPVQRIPRLLLFCKTLVKLVHVSSQKKKKRVKLDFEVET
jgi:hypothetical protein